MNSIIDLELEIVIAGERRFEMSQSDTFLAFLTSFELDEDDFANVEAFWCPTCMDAGLSFLEPCQHQRLRSPFLAYCQQVSAYVAMISAALPVEDADDEDDSDSDSSNEGP